MANFVMECPGCGKMVAAKTGIFARRKIECDCGHTIHVRTEKLTARTCPHCGNVFAYDQSDGRKVRCPSCRHIVVATEDETKTAEFSCGQCGVRLRATRGTEKFVCPVCDFENDVAHRLKKENLTHDGLASVIKYEGDGETLVWKHPTEDFNLGSQLIVHESQEAVFFRDGQALDLFGAGRYTLETQQLPLLEKAYRLPTNAQGAFHSEIYYVNLATVMGVKWGTDTKVRLFDPASGMHVEIGASGEFNIRVANARKLLLKLVGTGDALRQDALVGGGKGYFRSMVMTQVKSYLAAVIREKAINILEIDEHLMALSEALREKINGYFVDYGLEIPEFYVARIVTPDEDPNFRRMKEMYAEQYLGVRQEHIRRDVAMAEAERRTVEAQTEAQMRIIGAQGEAEAMKIRAVAEAEAYRAQAMAEAEEMRAKGYTYQQETARQVGLEALKNGIGGGESGGAVGGMLGGIGEIAGLGMTLGAMGGVMNMTKDALNPVMATAAQMGQTVSGAVNGGAAGGWNCTCGQRDIASNFCPNCGAKKPEPKSGWDCVCGARGITTNFCPDCGAKKPEQPAGWNCPDCGRTGIASNFCPNCGAKKPAESWICPDCGQRDIKTNFCPNCGHRKGV